MKQLLKMPDVPSRPSSSIPVPYLEVREPLFDQPSFDSRYAIYASSCCSCRVRGRLDVTFGVWSNVLRESLSRGVSFLASGCFKLFCGSSGCCCRGCFLSKLFCFTCLDSAWLTRSMTSKIFAFLRRGESPCSSSAGLFAWCW